MKCHIAGGCCCVTSRDTVLVICLFVFLLSPSRVFNLLYLHAVILIAVKKYLFDLSLLFY